MKIKNEFLNSYKLNLNNLVKTPSFAKFLEEYEQASGGAVAASGLAANGAATGGASGGGLAAGGAMASGAVAAGDKMLATEASGGTMAGGASVGGAAGAMASSAMAGEASGELLKAKSQMNQTLLQALASKTKTAPAHKSRFSEKDLIALKEQTDAFEAFFIKNMLDIALPKHSDSLFQKDAADEIYQDMYHDAVAKALSGKMGLSEILFNYLQES